MEQVMEIEFIVQDMTCGHCVKSITQAVQEVSENAQVIAHTESHRVMVKGAGDAAAVEGAIRAAGYTPQRV
jgi:copper chaperone